MNKEILNLDIQSNGVAIVELHRPEARNALNLELRQQLAATFAQLAACLLYTSPSPRDRG